MCRRTEVVYSECKHKGETWVQDCIEGNIKYPRRFLFSVESEAAFSDYMERRKLSCATVEYTSWIAISPLCDSCRETDHHHQQHQRNFAFEYELSCNSAKHIMIESGEGDGTLTEKEFGKALCQFGFMQREEVAEWNDTGHPAALDIQKYAASAKRRLPEKPDGVVVEDRERPDYQSSVIWSEVMELAEYRRKPEGGPEERTMFSNMRPLDEEPVSPRTAPSQLPAGTLFSGSHYDSTQEDTTLLPPAMSTPSNHDFDTSSDEDEDESPQNGAIDTTERMRKRLRIDSVLPRNNFRPAIRDPRPLTAMSAQAVNRGFGFQSRVH